MGFTIDQMIVNGDSKVVALDWIYTNADGSLRNQLRLAEPYGDVPLAKVTSDVASEWLTNQLPNEPAEFDAELARRKEEKAVAASMTAYEAHPVNAPTKVSPEPEPEPEPEAEVEVEITPEVLTMPIDLEEPEATTQPAPAKRPRRKKKAD